MHAWWGSAREEAVTDPQVGAVVDFPVSQRSCQREYPHRMNTETIALVCAGLGVIFSVVYLVLGVSGIRLLRDLRDRMNRS